MRYSELTILHEDVSNYLACAGADVSDLDSVLTEAGINISIDNLSNNLNNENLKDPMVVSKLKKEIQSAKRWDKILKIVQKLNAILAGGVLVGGTAKLVSGSKAANAASAAYAQASSAFLTPAGDFNAVANAGNDLANANASVQTTKAAMVMILLIQAAVAVMAPLLKTAIKNREVNNLSTVKGQVDSSIKLYEKQIKHVKSESDRKKLQDAIDRLKDLKETMDSESERLANEDKPKSDN